MKTAAIICEYNPFHNGHRYQIEQIRRQLNPDHIIAVMSGDFVQRGAPAFCGKYTRAKSALINGVDLVLELPVCYSCSSAQFFASGAVSLLHSLNCVDYLVFGTEADSKQPFEACSHIFKEEPDKYRQILKKRLKDGLPFPAARVQAVSAVMGKDLSDLLKMPNNILALEYYMALSSFDSTILPYPIRRIGADYHDSALKTFSSATGIRTEILKNGVCDNLKAAVPNQVYEILFNQYQKIFPLEWNDFDDMLYYQLITDPLPEKYLDYHPELMDRILKYARNFHGTETLIADTKSKNVTYARISRYLLHLMLKITKEQASSPCGYAKILGMKKSHSFLVKHLYQKSDIPVIQKISQYKRQLSGNALLSFEQTLNATELYRYMIRKKYKTKLPTELSQPLLIV